MKDTGQLKSIINRNNVLVKLATTGLLLAMVGCGSSSDDDDKMGFIKFYNASSNSPAIYLTIDEDLDQDEDDEIEITYRPASYGDADSRRELPVGEYFYELAWQDEDSTARADLELIHQAPIRVDEDMISFIVVSGEVNQALVNVYDIALIDDDDDDSQSLFNLRLLNMHDSGETLDVYVSKSDETFNEAVLVGEYAHLALSDNIKYPQDQYKFYLTSAGQQDVLFESSAVNFAYASQYVMVIRDNLANDDSPYIIDKVSASNVESFSDDNANAQVRLFNGIDEHFLLPHYQNAIDVVLTGNDEVVSETNLTRGQFSSTIGQDSGDFSLQVKSSATEELLLNNHLLTLPSNANRSVFLYLTEDNVDHDGDGDVDEDGDGFVDEVEINIHSLVVDNSTEESIYDHQLQLINLVDSDDFTSVSFYFVRSDETIASAQYYANVDYAASQSLRLRNNTYQVFAVARHNSSEIILDSFSLTLDEESNAMFLVLEKDQNSASGYRTTMEVQVAQSN